MNFMTSNQEYFQASSSIYNTNTRNKHHLHKQNAKMSCFMFCYMTKFQAALRKYLNTHYFQIVDPFFCVKDDL